MCNVKIGDDDLVFSYKEDYFTGFAPCFEGGIYSLACCKGAKNGNSLRQTACKAFLAGRSVWILAIASATFRDEGHNKSQIEYSRGDAIYLAKVDGVYTWKEYSDSHANRSDSIYELRNGEITWRDNYHGSHRNEKDKATDCATSMKGMTPIETFINQEQILISREYYVFDKGCKIMGIDAYSPLEVFRGYSYAKDKEKRVESLRMFLEINHNFKYLTGQDPFKNTVSTSSKCGGCR